MKILITGCQTIREDKVINACPFCNYIREWGNTILKCKLGANLHSHDTIILTSPPEDCPIKKEDVTFTTIK